MTIIIIIFAGSRVIGERVSRGKWRGGGEGEKEQVVPAVRGTARGAKEHEEETQN